MKPTLLVMAAGMGSRYGGLKQLEPVGPGGETILDYSIYDALRAGFGRLVFVVSRSIESVTRETFGARYGDRADLSFIRQELDMIPEGFIVPEGRRKPWGTGHATLVADSVVNEPFAVINADDFYGARAYRLLADAFETVDSAGSDYVMVGFPLGETLSDHGPVSRSISETDPAGHLIGAVELEAIVREGNSVRGKNRAGVSRALTGSEIVSMNFWGFTPSIFAHLRERFVVFLDAGAANEDSSVEFYLPAAVDHLISTGAARVRVLEGGGPWYGLTYPEDKPAVVAGIAALVGSGVYPERLWE
jgi:UTP-glucose-1-phosphate uridylyltransferase